MHPNPGQPPLEDFFSTFSSLEEVIFIHGCSGWCVYYIAEPRFYTILRISQFNEQIHIPPSYCSLNLCLLFEVSLKFQIKQNDLLLPVTLLSFDCILINAITLSGLT